MDITKQDFIQWKDNAVTQAFMAYLEQEKSEYTKLDETLANQVLHGNASTETIALDSVARASIVSGISMATDLQSFGDEMFDIEEFADV